MLTLLLGAAYLLGALAANAGFYLVGAAAWPGGAVDASRRLSDRFLAASCRYALGWVIAGVVGVSLGLSGLYRPIPLLGTLGLLAALGALRESAGRRRARLDDGRGVGSMARARATWRSLDAPVRAALLIAFALNGLLSANLLVGAMVPDSWHDSLWYHLTLPGQWLIRGDVAMFPRVMPSTYMLGAHAAYGAILAAGGEILLTCVLAQAMLLLMASMVAAAWRMAGPRGGALAAGSLPLLFGALFAIAPFAASNDGVSALMLGAAAWTLLAPALAGRPSSRRDALLAGALGGGAIASKLVALGYFAPALCVAAAWEALRQRKIGAGTSLAARAGAAAICVLAPWLLRGAVECGHPLMPLAPRAFALRPEFSPVLRGYDEVPRFHEAAPGETLGASLIRNAKEKAMYAFAWPNAFAPLMLVATFAAFARREAAWRAQALLLAACWAGLAALNGKLELGRYFGLSYPLAAPAIGLLLAFASRSFRGWSFVAAAAAFFALSAWTYHSRQMDVARFRTIDWPFRPLLLERDSLPWLVETEDGPAFAAFRAAQDALPPRAFVLVADQLGPYYLRRRALWSDYASGDPLEGFLGAPPWEPLVDVAETARRLRSLGVDHVIAARMRFRGPVDARLAELEAFGALEPVPLDVVPPSGGRLWRVAGAAENPK